MFTGATGGVVPMALATIVHTAIMTITTTTVHGASTVIVGAAMAGAMDIATGNTVKTSNGLQWGPFGRFFCTIPVQR